MDGETGILFQSEDYVDLAEKILLVHANREINERIRTGGSREVVHHSVENYLNNLKKMYRDL
jgi:glycosyltransferase involved in cell wall biosynthesis